MRRSGNHTVRCRLLLVGFITALHLSPPAISQAQTPVLIDRPEFRATLTSAIDSVYNYQFDASYRLLEPWKEQYPRHPMWTFWDGLTLWWRVLADLRSTELDDRFFYQMKKSSYEAGRVLRREPTHKDALIILATSRGFVARLNANRENWISAMNEGREAYNAFERLRKYHPTMADNPFAEGLYLYYLEYVPNTYPVVKTVSWALPEGSISGGLEKLREASEEGLLSRAESRYFLARMLMDHQHQPDTALSHFQYLHRYYPENEYYANLMLRAYIKAKRYQTANSFADSLLSVWGEGKALLSQSSLLEARAWRGRLEYQLGNYGTALTWFDQITGNALKRRHETLGKFEVMAAYYSGLINCQKGRLERCKVLLQAAAESEVGSELADKAARRLSKLK